MKLDKEQLLQAYRIMRRIRNFETRIGEEFAAGNVPGTTHLYIGQEAVAAGICLTLSEEEYIASTHRGHGHCIAKGCDIPGMALELFRRQGGLCNGKGGSMHIAEVGKGMLGANAIVGGAAPLACGAALAAKIRGNKHMAVAFAGDGATNQGTTFEAMNMAVVLKLPVVFAIESNGYGECTGSSYAQGNDLTERSAAFGMAAVKVDGTDFFAVHEAMQEAIERANRGEGPTSIECVAMRWHGHYEGDPQLYRPADEVDQLRETADPLKIFREKVVASGDLKDADMDQIDKEVLAEVTNAVDAALEAPHPAPEELLSDVYASY